MRVRAQTTKQGRAAKLAPSLADSCEDETAEVRALKQRIQQLERQQQQQKNRRRQSPKTALEKKLIAENKELKTSMERDRSRVAKRRRRTAPASIPIHPRLHAYLLPLVFDKDPTGPLFSSERRGPSGEEKPCDSDTMLKMLRNAARRAGLKDWVR